MNIDLWRELVKLLDADKPCATAVITRASGSIPNAVGATLLADSAGLIAGTVGGGEIEHRTLEQCKEAIAAGEHRAYKYLLTDEEAGGIGMMCGGNADLFIQVHRPRPQLVLFGAGHVNVELARFAERFDWGVTVVDERADWCSEAHYPRARRLVAPVAEAVGEITWSERSTYVVIATADHDEGVLREVMDKPCCYIGMVASKRKAILMTRKLKEQGHDIEAMLTRLRAPVGLDLGGRAPADVALSILAEVQALRHGKDGTRLTLPADKLR